MSNTLCLLLTMLPSAGAAESSSKSPQYAAGSVIVVTKDGAPLMDRSQTVTTARRGCRLQVTEVRDPWLKTKVYRGDKPYAPWTHKSNVRPYDVTLDFGNRADQSDARYNARLQSLIGSSERRLAGAVKVAWINAWRETLLKVLDSPEAESLLTNDAFVKLLPTVDSLFRPDNRYKRTAVATLEARTKQLSKEDIQEWRTALEAASGEPVLDFHVAMLLIQQDRLFHRARFDRTESELWLGRLKSIPMPELLGWSERTRKPPHRAAMVLVQADSLFQDNQFQTTAFEEHLRNDRLLTSR